jgi:Zn-dependent peptidase ImmA (M78 family)
MGIVLESIKIMGCDYAIVELDRISREGYVYGEVDHVEQVIKLSKELKPQLKAEILLHELIHAVLFKLGENELHDNERFINGMAAVLFQIFKDNAALLTFFLGLG